MGNKSVQIGVVTLFLVQGGGFPVTGKHPQIGFNLGQPLQGLLHLLPAAAGQIRASAGTGEQGVSGEEGAIHQQADGTGGVSRGVEHGDVQPARCSWLPSA